MAMSKREEWAAEHCVQLPPDDDPGAFTELERRVNNATGAHNELERLVQKYYQMPTEQTADLILAAAQNLKDAWTGK